MDCPYCGSPVMIRGKYWECGYCGDSGILSDYDITFDESDLEASFSLSVSFVINLEETWSHMKEALISVGDACLLHSMAQMVIYEISRALYLSHRTLPKEKKLALGTFLRSTHEFQGLMGECEILKAAEQKRILYESEGKIDERTVGSFWETLINSTQNDDCPVLDGIFSSLGDIYQYFVSDALDNSSYEREDYLRNAFETHWYQKRLFTPNTVKAEERLGRDDLSCIDHDLRDILVKNFPELFKKYSVDDMHKFFASKFFRNLLKEDSHLAETIWKWLQTYLSSIPAVGKEITRYMRGINPFPPIVPQKPTETKNTCKQNSSKQYRYVQVRIQPGNKVYSYRTEEETLRVGDQVLVPFGMDNHLKVGTILEIGMYSADHAPFPPDRTKFVVSIYEKD